MYFLTQYHYFICTILHFIKRGESLMSNTEFGLSFLKDKLKDIPFQVWEYDYLQDRIHLIHTTGYQKNIPPSFHEPNNKESTYKVIKQEAKVSIILFYPDGNQVHVSIFDSSTILTIKEIPYLYHFFTFPK